MVFIVLSADDPVDDNLHMLSWISERIQACTDIRRLGHELIKPYDPDGAEDQFVVWTG